MDKRSQVYELIDGERDYQDKKWNAETTETSGKHSPAEWLVYMQDYLTEAFNLAARNADPEASNLVMDNIRKITAMGVHAMEQNKTLPR